MFDIMEGRIRNWLNMGGDRGRRLKINVVTAFALKGMSILMSLFIVPLTLSYLTQYEYGVWLTLNSILLWINYFDVGLGNGLRNKLTEAIAENDLEKGCSYVSTTFFLLGLIVAVVIILFSVINHFLDWNAILNTTERPIENINSIVFIVFVFCCFSFMMKIIGTIYVANQQPMVNDAIGFAGQLFSLLFIYLLVKFTQSNLMYIAICYSGVPVLVYLLFYPYTFKFKYKYLSPSFKMINLEYTKALGGMGIQFFILQIACLILYSTSNLIITQWFGAEEVTPYNIAYRYMSIATMAFSIIVNPLWSAITDAFVRKEFLWIKKSVSTMTKIWGLFILLLLFLILVSQFVFKIWLGGEVHISYSLLWILAIFVGVDLWNKIYSSFSCGVGHLKVQISSAIVEAVLFLPLAFVLSKILGVNGVVLALGIVSFIPAIVLFVDYKRTLDIL